MRASGKSMWWNVEESEGRRNLNAPIVTMPRIRKVTWGDIAALDIMKLFQLRLIAAQFDSGTDDWEQLDPGNMSDVVGSTPQQPLVEEVVQRKPTRPTPVCAPTTKSKVSKDLLTPRAPSPFRHPMTTPRKRSSIDADLSPVSVLSSRDANTQTQRQLVDASTQTNGQFEDVGTQTEGHKRRKLDRVQETYQRDGKTVVEIHDDENSL